MIKPYVQGVVGLVSATAIIGGVVLGGWEAGWWFTNQNANRQAHVIRNGYSNQQTLRDEITRKLGDVTTLDSQVAAARQNSDANEVAVLTAQRRVVASIVCHDAEQVVGDSLPQDQLEWASQNCVMGSAK